MALIEEAHKGARLLLDHAYVRILARPTPDAACAAALLAHALRRENVDFHVSWAPRLDDATIRALAEERADLAVLIGLAGDAARAECGATRAIALDSAPPTLAADATVHDDASLAGLAHLVAAGVSRRNVDLAPLALAGALASHRYVGGHRGLDAEILRESLDAGIVLREPALALHGTTLAGALSQLDAPYVAGVTGRARNVKKLLADLHLPGEAPPSALSPEEAERLGDFVALRLLQQDAPDAALDALYRPMLRSLQGPHTGLECGELARLAEAAMVAERGGVAFAALWPDPAAGGEAADLVSDTRDAMVQALLAAERDARTEGALVVAEAPRASMCRPIADRLALSRPGGLFVVHAPEADGARLAIRSFAQDAGAIARKAAPIAGALAAGDVTAAELRAPDAGRAIKALAEVLVLAEVSA